ncbi:hypothetical protein D3C87_692070 [compost metagenome]
MNHNALVDTNEQIGFASRFNIISDDQVMSDEEALRRANGLSPEEQQKPYQHQALTLGNNGAKRAKWGDQSPAKAPMKAPTQKREVQSSIGYMKPEIITHEDPTPVLFSEAPEKKERVFRGQGLFGRNARRRRMS